MDKMYIFKYFPLNFIFLDNEELLVDFLQRPTSALSSKSTNNLVDA